jgi:ankyrin repeat protein
MAAIRSTRFCAILLIAALILNACSRRTIQHGNLRYDVREVFAGDPGALALAEAAGRGDVREINRLVAAAANVNAVGKYGITPLWWAAWAENYDGFATLLENKADPNAYRAEGLPIMHVVVQFDEARFLSAALKHGGNPDALDVASGDTPLFRTVLFGLEEQTDILLKAGANVNARQAVTRWTLPMRAISSRADYKLVYRLLELGADYTLKTNQGDTLADIIAARAIAPNDEQYLWREKVMNVLRSKGVEVHRPTHESPRTRK